MTFQGSLEELPLPDIIQLVSVSGKTGRFDLSSQEDEGQIFLREGQIVHARTSSLEGEEAIYELAIWPRGHFVFTPDRISTTTTIDKSNTNLLMEAARRIDEWQILSKKIHSVHLVPVFTDTDEVSVSFSPFEWAVIRRIDERRTIEEIAIALGVSPFETCKQIYGLITAGYIQLRSDLSRRLGPELWQLDRDEAHERMAVIHEQASSILESKVGAAVTSRGPVPPAADPTLALARSLQLSMAELNSGRCGHAVVDLARAAEQIIVDTVGRGEADTFLLRLEESLNNRVILSS